jgi:hypothetical protein
MARTYSGSEGLRSAERYGSTVVAEYTDTCGKRREDVDALAGEVGADVMAGVEAVGEMGEGSRGDFGRGRSESGAKPSVLVSAGSACENCAIEVSILREEDVMAIWHREIEQIGAAVSVTMGSEGGNGKRRPLGGAQSVRSVHLDTNRIQRSGVTRWRYEPCLKEA